MREAGLDILDKRLLSMIQSAFPLTPAPFRSLSGGLGVEESEIIRRVHRLKEDGVIRQIGAIFDSRRLGYTSTLVAGKVPPERIDGVARVVSAHPGVSHNYARAHRYNLWFTLTLPPGQSTERTIADLARRSGVDGFLNLPALRVFKISMQLNMLEGEERNGDTWPAEGQAPPEDGAALSDRDILLVRLLQQDLPVEERPFARFAALAGLDERELLSEAERLQRLGIMRRFAAVLRHRKAGFAANAMGAWAVPEIEIEQAGRTMASFAEVSHCYQRPTYPDWPYSLFTMIHGRTTGDCERVAGDISRRTGITEYELLYSVKEYKKVRVKYFEEGENADQEV